VEIDFNGPYVFSAMIKEIRPGKGQASFACRAGFLQTLRFQPAAMSDPPADFLQGHQA